MKGEKRARNFHNDRIAGEMQIQTINAWVKIRCIFATCFWLAGAAIASPNASQSVVGTIISKSKNFHISGMNHLAKSSLGTIHH